MSNRGCDVPDNLTELFKTGEASYSYFEDYQKSTGMDNVESMRWFVETVGIPEDAIEVDDGTQLTLVHSNYSHKLVIDSYGRGDFHSHAFDVSILKEMKV